MSKNSIIPGLILIALGVIFLLANLGIISGLKDWWPVIIIAIGAGMLFQNKTN